MLQALLLAVAGCFGSTTFAQPALENVSFLSQSAQQLEIELRFNQRPPQPDIFEVNNPASLSLDFANVSSNLNQRRFPVQAGIANSVLVLEAQGRTRMVVNMSSLQAYQTRVEGNSLFLTLGQATAAPVAAAAPAVQAQTATGSIGNVDFRRADDGSGQIIVELADRSLAGSVRRTGNSLNLEFRNASIPDARQERLDVTDFGTLVRNISVYNEAGSVMVVADVVGDYEYLAYQNNNAFIVNVTPRATAAEARAEARASGFSGERISLNFQNIPVRSVLQTLAEFQDFSLVVSDAVSGNVTLRLVDVPWDQALDLVLRSRGLGQRLEGNVLYVAPAGDITAAEIQMLENSQQAQSLVPLETAYIPVNYAVAAEMVPLISGEGGGLLSARGSVSVDARTNTLIVRDAPSAIEQVMAMLERLDVPVRQVQIQARIVNAEASFSESLGIRWGGAHEFSTGDTFTLSGGLNSFNPIDFSDDQLVVDLGVPSASSALTLGYRGNSGLLELELSALQESGRGEVVAQPSLTTQDQQQAQIRSGLQIPYQTQAGGTAGGTTTEFIDAVLSLDVTPQITPDGRIIMLLNIHQDSVVPAGPGGVPAISTNNITTRVLVDNGDTIVLGGVFREEDITTVSRTILLGDLPVIGNLFRRTISSSTKTELLIFITPSIIEGR